MIYRTNTTPVITVLYKTLPRCRPLSGVILTCVVAATMIKPRLFESVNLHTLLMNMNEEPYAE